LRTPLTPARRRGIEILDNPAVDPALLKRGMRDVERANRLLGGRRAALIELEPSLRAIRGAATLLDVGIGRGDIAAAAQKRAATLGFTLTTIGVDNSHPIVTDRREANQLVVRSDALELPFADASVDIVLASQILHHFREPDAVAFVREMNRVARARVVISDIRRSFIAAAGLWLGSFPLGFHPVSRHDGVVSVMRGFLSFELADIVDKATGKRPVVNQRLGFRLTTSWKPVR
jgi:hypothetical protein